ncbi:LOW QUALITY PROTEIN: fumarate hydratase, mitochondrial-like [Drosophila tropicalis]|uniref:LOW QUALITY PROTEIN: fumarate hydratase, mitochondrial-like n=1 Tax=Drosophila tropicalis TaxID=46794 RepID=UPI0035AB6FBC
MVNHSGKLEARIESDALGSLKVPTDRYFGAQTMRSSMQYHIGGDEERVPRSVIQAMGILKKAAAEVNQEYGLDPQISSAIAKAADELINGKLYDEGHFPLHIWQSGSGAQTNMNVNEVISNRAIEIMGGQIGSRDPVHPVIDHVNNLLSPNDTYPTAIHIAVGTELVHSLKPALIMLRDSLKAKSIEWNKIIETGHTQHTENAGPTTLIQEFSDYAQQLSNSLERLEAVLPRVWQLRLGGSIVGTGHSTRESFSEKCIERIAQITSLPFAPNTPTPNFMESLDARDAMVEVHAALNTIAVSIMKIANGVRFLFLEPHCGLGEVKLPETEDGSPSMPGTINLTYCEVLTMICVQVMGNHVAVTIGGSNGHFELNAFKPLIASNVLRSIKLLTDGCISFSNNCLRAIDVNKERLAKIMSSSLVLASRIGFEEACQIAATALMNGSTLKEECLKMGIAETEINDWIPPDKMLGPH